MSALLAAAEAWADRCVPCFPCAADKAPLTPNGFNGATIDHTAGLWRSADLLGIPTGAASLLDVLDIDPRHGGDTWLAEHGARLPVTRTVHTRSGGLHLYLRAKPGLSCSVSRIADGVDVRAEGGYVIDWSATGHQVQNADTIADWPEWLADAAQASRVRHADSPTRSVADLAPPDAAAVIALLERMPNPASATRDDYIRVMMAAKGCIDGLGEDEGISDAAIDWACRWPGSPGECCESTKWENDFATRDAPLAGWSNLLAAAVRLGVDTTAERADLAADQFAGVVREQPGRAPNGMRGRFVFPSDCATGPRRGYIIKRLIAPGDVGAVVGEPGCGKSMLAPFLAYAVAQGRQVFGTRTKQGRTLYVAAEDITGMRQRVHALKLAHGDTPDFALVDCGNLNDANTAADLRAAVADWKPVLVVIDTVAAAWAGMSENDSESMGAVVKFARAIAATGAGVVLVHHPAKHGDGTPRGHSSLNGTLDMCLQLKAAESGDVVRARLTKNRNGALDLDIAFRKTSVLLGVDEDGDEITAPRADELAQRDMQPARPGLRPKEQRALGILHNLAPAGCGVTEEAWHAACENARIIVSDDPRNRRKVVATVMRTLLEKQYVVASGGLFRVCGGTEAFVPWNRVEQ